MYRDIYCICAMREDHPSLLLSYTHPTSTSNNRKSLINLKYKSSLDWFLHAPHALWLKLWSFSLQVVILSWVYGFDRTFDNLRDMGMGLNKIVRGYWLAVWVVLTPIASVVSVYLFTLYIFGQINPIYFCFSFSGCVYFHDDRPGPDTIRWLCFSSLGWRAWLVDGSLYFNSFSCFRHLSTA